MKQYLTQPAAIKHLDSTDILSYPSLDTNIENFPPIPPVQIDGKLTPTAGPSNLTLEAVGYFGQEPKRILDIGCGTGRAALYLAKQGHNVTAIDPDKGSYDWVKDRANQLGIPDKDFRIRTESLADLPTTERYDGILAEMVLHYFTAHDVLPAIKKIQGLTRPNGLNILSAYTEDNPEEEITLRGLHYLLKPGELAAAYLPNWKLHRNEEGLYSRSLDRSNIHGKNLALIPTVAEIIARKPLHPASQRVIMNARRELIVIGQEALTS